MVIIKKYSNRRLYDTKASKYITLDELAEMIRSGAEPKVVDARSDEDLTQATLTQIIMESRGAAKMLTVPVLMQLIRLEPAALTEFMSTTLSWALQAYLGALRGVSHFNPLQMLSGVNPFELLYRQWLTGSRPAEGGTRAKAGAPAQADMEGEPVEAVEVPAGAAKAQEKAREAGRGELELLRREIEAMRLELEGLRKNRES